MPNWHCWRWQAAYFWRDGFPGCLWTWTRTPGAAPCPRRSSQAASPGWDATVYPGSWPPTSLANTRKGHVELISWTTNFIRILKKRRDFIKQNKRRGEIFHVLEAHKHWWNGTNIQTKKWCRIDQEAIDGWDGMDHLPLLQALDALRVKLLDGDDDALKNTILKYC